jgi:hypothetical protein
LTKTNKEIKVYLKNFLGKEKKMMSLLVLLKKQGVPVEEIYEKQFVKDQKKRLRTVLQKIRKMKLWSRASRKL